ncbi:DUF4876 domain-containing protein [Niabella pedocola]|uniref:DUF4876 domain-containing protein n=1 Tax=Niabella pedocola TaxID=1752077 RepID=A0ABS8PP16_9BACT|nr:DUF4876 domain-containing protein [Niabella pedocola]MCD2422057.1 DUF4876 domain-containing protein [Niabella pedocola]
MKQLSLGILILLVFAVSCKRDDLMPGVQPVTIIAKVNYDASNKDYGFPLSNISVTLKNTSTNSSLSQSTDNSGIAIFNSVTPGVYNIEATFKITKADYENKTGVVINHDEVVFNAVLNNVTLNSTTSNTLELPLSTGKIGDWVIKQIYYEGSGTNGAAFRDQFIEIYNNSNDTLFADSLYFGQLAGTGSTAASIDLAKGYYISDQGNILYKQFDWSKSLNMPATIGPSANNNFVYIKSLYRIPGNGSDVPVAPGKSIVIAASAQNHQAAYVGADGKEISAKDPSLTLDLSKANFEVYLRDLITNPYPSDVDNANIKNVVVCETGGDRDLILDLTGRDAYFIFKSDRPFPAYGQPANPNSYPKYPDPSVTAITATTDLYYQVPNSIIIDAVQIQNTIVNNRHPRKLVAALDGGVTNVPGGLYSSQSAIRKTSKIINGRVVLMDTNNSSNDFDYLPKAAVGAFK